MNSRRPGARGRIGARRRPRSTSDPVLLGQVATAGLALAALACALVTAPCAVATAADSSPATTTPAPANDLVDASRLDPRFVVDIRYATPDNFTGKRLYPVARCLVRRAVGDELVLAQKWLDAHRPGYVLVLKDCYRPDSVQRVMFAVVKGTPRQGYVADPDRGGSVHSFGAAVDVTLAEGGVELDMGTPYDFLGPLAQPRFEERFLAEGKLTRAQLERRHVLREAMMAAGFRMISNEWWHFDAWWGAALRARYAKLDVRLDAVP